MNNISKKDELKHFGILGMHWGVRRYQNPDGSLTPEGRKRYGVKTAAETKRETYSKKLSSLEYKKNRTEKEEKEYRSLRNGKRFYERWAGVHMDEDAKKLYSEEYSQQWKDADKWLRSTNYYNRGLSYGFLFGPIGTLISNSTHLNDLNNELLEASGRTNAPLLGKKGFADIIWNEAKETAAKQLKNKRNADNYEDLLYEMTEKIIDQTYDQYVKKYKKEHSINYTNKDGKKKVDYGHYNISI